MFLFYVLSFFKNGDTIQGGTLFKGGHYLRKYGICNKIFLPYQCLIDKSLFFHYKVFTNENSLFCIIDTNSKEAFTYLDREPVHNVTYFEAMKARHKAFIWPSSSLEGPKKTTNESKDTHYRLFFVRSTYFFINNPKI